MSEKANQIGRILLIGLALSGIIIMGYLTSLHHSPQQDLFCDLGRGFSCDIVNKSSYASILGIPVSILGLLYFIAVLGLSIFRYNKLSIKRIILISILSLGPSLYLTFIEIFVLENICVVCETAKVIMIGIILVSLFALRPEKFGLQGFVIAITLAVLLGAVMYFIQAGNESVMPSGDYDEFAQCLYDKGMRMYGSVTCLYWQGRAIRSVA